MTKANFDFKNNLPYAFQISGHANYDEYGKDIVCSSITTAVFTTLNLLDKLLKKEDYSLFEDEDKGIIEFSLNIESELSSTIILNLLDIMKNIEEQYPRNLKININ